MLFVFDCVSLDIFMLVYYICVFSNFYVLQVGMCIVSNYWCVLMVLGKDSVGMYDLLMLVLIIVWL